MADYLAGTTTEIYFAGMKIGEITGFKKDPTITWSEDDFVGFPLRQFIPIKQDATGTIDRYIPNWQMLALALGQTYYDTTTAKEVFESGENDGIFWRYLEYNDVPPNQTTPVSMALTTTPPVVLGEFIGRCPKLNYVKM